jgi:tetratricopeptide (TPR) repeat protein
MPIVPPPPAARASVVAARLRGLPSIAAQHLRRIPDLLASGDLAGAELALMAARALAPSHPEALRWAAAVAQRRGRAAEAVALLDEALAQWPADPELLLAAAALDFDRDDHARAQQRLSAASTLPAGADFALRLSLEAERQGYIELALAAADAALAGDPRTPRALLQRGRSLHALGRADDAAAVFRGVIARDPANAAAWFSLLDQKTIRVSASELDALCAAEARAQGGDEDATLLGFALGKALEDHGRHAEALAAFQRANARVRRRSAWDAAQFSRQVDAVLAAFDGPVAQADGGAGEEVLFVVGLPRSGTTLIEQVLAAHPQVEGASELPYLHRVVAGESQRRGQAFPAWAGAASASDWARLGADYLRRSARWRTRRPRSTDKLPANWLLAGAALAMLPGTRVVALLRDPLETAWSCYKQLFGREQVGFAYDFADLAAYWRDYERTVRFFAARDPRRFRAQSYEAFVADPEGQTRELLEFCGLPFDPACLRFHEAERSVRTASAAQVRQPLRRDTARAAAYGALLDPLRVLLAGKETSP